LPCNGTTLRYFWLIPPLILLCTGLGCGKSGLPLESLPRATATLYGYWRERDQLLDDTQEWHSSALIVEERKGALLLVTNSHCLDLRSLARADLFTDDVPEVAEYRITIRIGGVEAYADVIAETPEPIDVALVAVRLSKLGSADYLIAPVTDCSQLKVGTKVAAVGSPLDPEAFEGTITFGYVSAIRNENSPCPVIQHDAPLNPGNSGGPLFAQLDPEKDEWYCVGVNFAKATEGEGIGLAWALRPALRYEYEFAPCSPQGAVDLIRSIYGRRATVVP